MMDTNDTANALLEQSVHSIYGFIASTALEGATPDTWQQALRIVLHDCGQYVDAGDAERWCTGAAWMTQGRVRSLLRHRSSQLLPPEECLLSTELLVQILQHGIVQSLLPSSPIPGVPCKNEPRTLQEQRYLVDHDISVLCRADQVIVDTALIAQMEQRYPGIMAAAEMVKTLFDDRDSRREALHTFQDAQANMSLMDLEAIGTVVSP